ncbi:hypothetical protein GACE_0345 [Geoglobus acetivorans]|uniref:Uncharacterized protein n=1 Tax=Geoglobus acetivorans TaxID=565033 RepID=A0A0A7GEM0_GEOAI|nr:hypothetical protein GACE_0345 [Geoglobus acetivorans]
MDRNRIYGLLKGIFRIQIGFTLIRIWSLNRVYPEKTNIHLFDLIGKMKQRK